MLYCIKCGKMVKEDSTPTVDLFHFNTIQVCNSFDPGSRYDLEVCTFPLGFTYCPPPEFDMDKYIEKFGNPPALLEDFKAYDNEGNQVVEAL